MEASCRYVGVVGTLQRMGIAARFSADSFSEWGLAPA